MKKIDPVVFEKKIKNDVYFSSSTSSPTIHTTPHLRDSPNYVKPQLLTTSSSTSTPTVSKMKKFEFEFKGMIFEGVDESLFEWVYNVEYMVTGSD